MALRVGVPPVFPLPKKLPQPDRNGNNNNTTNNNADGEPSDAAKRALNRAAEQDNAFAVKLYPCYSILAISFYLKFNYASATTPAIVIAVTLAVLPLFLLYSGLERRLMRLPSGPYYDWLAFYRVQQFFIYRLFILLQVILLAIFVISGGTI